MLRSASVSRFRASPLAGVFSGAEGIVSPLQLPGAEAWYDVSDLSSMRNDAGAIPSNGEGVKLISDKSGNSGVNVLCLNGVAGNYASAPDSVPLSIVGDIVLVGYIAPNDWTPAANQLIVSKYNTTSGNHRSYWLRHLTTGALNFNWSDDGISATAVNSTATIGSADFAPLWVAAAFDVNNGAGGNDCRFYTSPDGSTWTQLGTTVTTAGVASIFDGPATINVGANDAGAFGNFTGLIYRAQIYSGIPAAFGGAGGTLVFDANFATAAKLAPSFTESSSNAATVTINTSGATGARISGARDLYQGTAANQPILTIAAAGNYLTFDGSNDYLKAAAFALSQPETVYFVGSQVTWTASDYLWGVHINTAGLAQHTSSPNLSAEAGAFITDNGNLSINTVGVVTTVLNSTSSIVRVNRGSLSSGNASTGALNGFTLGSAGTGGNPANITASEVLVYSTAQNTAQQDALILYLGRHNGIAV